MVQKKVAILFIFILGTSILPAKANNSTQKYFTAEKAQIVAELVGFTRARHAMDIVSKESGYCTEVLLDVGDTVGEKGVFARLERIYINLQIQENKERQRLLKTKISFLSKEFKRYLNLFKSKNIDQSTLDRIKNELDLSRHELEIEKVREKRLIERRKDHIISAPAGWKVISRSIEPGQWVRTGQVLAQAGDYKSMLVPFSLSPVEFQALKAKSGSLTLYFNDNSQERKKIQARIERVCPSFDPETRKTKVDLEVFSKKIEPRGGQKAVLTLDLPDPSGAVLVPESSLLASYGEHSLVRKNGQRVPVLLLGQGPHGTLRVKSKYVQPGQTFITNPASLNE